MNRVKQHRALDATTISPASSASPPICWTMVKDAMAVAEPKMAIMPANSTSLIPARYARVRKMPGITTSLPRQTSTRSFM